MAIKLSGLNSGMDTESIIQELVRAKSEKKIKLEGEQKKLEWKQEKWKELNSKIYGLYSKTLSNMRLQSDYTKKTTKASNDAVSIVTGGNTPNGVQTLKINKMATSGYMTGGKIAEKSGTYTSSTKINSITGVTGESSFNIKVGDKETQIKIDDSTTINDLLTSMRSAGVNANFDEVNQRFFISAKESGADNDFAITAGSMESQKMVTKLGLAVSLDDAASAEYHKYADKLVYTDGKLDEAASLANMQSLISDEVAKRTAERADAVTQAQTKIADLQNELTTATEALANIETSITEKDEEIADFIAAYDPVNGTMAGTYSEQDYNDALTALEEQKTALEEQKAVASQNVTDINAEITKQQAVITEAEKYYSEDTVGKEMLATAKEYASVLNDSGATRIKGTDSEIELNGVVYKGTKNTFEINDMTITINSKTDEEITLTTSDDTDGIYDMVKNFFKEYNELINEMDKLYNADSARKYDMLTDEEREAISEDEAEEWDNKIKGALLRKDSTLGTVFNSMKTIMLQGVKMSDGSKLYLADFGIETMGYFEAEENERNAFHIAGDEDDEHTCNDTDKLRAAIAADPAVVAEFFSGLAKNLYERLDDLMARTELSSAFTVYNDKALKEEYEKYKDKIADQEEKIADFEDRYYDQFSKMEVAMSKLNSQQSALSSLFSM